MNVHLDFGDGWVEVDFDDDQNDIEVVQHWVPADGRWHTYLLNPGNR